MTIELGGMPMLLDVRGNPVLYEGDVVAVQNLRNYEEVQQRCCWDYDWQKPLIITKVNEKGFCARYLFDGDSWSEFVFGTVNVKLLARGGDDDAT